MSLATPDFRSAPSEFHNEQIVSGLLVSLASMQNKRRSNDDRAGISHLGGPRQGNTHAVSHDLMNAVRNCVGENHGGDDDGSGTTALTGVYDPGTNDLSLITHGDSTAYIVLHDGKHAVAVRISSPHHTTGYVVTNGLRTHEQNRTRPEGLINYRFEPDPPGFIMDGDLYNNLDNDEAQHRLLDLMRQRRGELFLMKDRPTINVDNFAKEAADRYGLNAGSLQATLIACTDGLEKAFELRHGIVDDRFSVHLAELVRHNHPHIAQAIANYKDSKTTDNCTAIVIPLPLAQQAFFSRGMNEEKGERIAFFVADGYGPNGGLYAQCALNGFENGISEQHGLQRRFQQQQQERFETGESGKYTSSDSRKAYGDMGRGGPELKSLVDQLIEKSESDSRSRR